MSLLSSAHKRLFYLDALRGIAVLLMIEQHLGVWLWRGPLANETIFDYPWLIAFNALGGLAAPLFISLAATGCVFFATSKTRYKLTLFQRGLLLLAMGYAFNYFVSTWFSMQSWFVLHLLGLGILLSPLLLRCSNFWLWCLGLGVMLLSAPLQTYFTVPWILTNEYMAGRVAATTWTPIRIPFLEGHFPIFPWLGMFILGIIAGRWLKAQQYKQIASVGCLMILMAGLCHYLIWIGVGVDIEWVYRGLQFQAPFFPASAAIVLLLTGCVWFSLAIIHTWDTRFPFQFRHWLVVLGRISLTLLVLHVWLFRQLGYESFLWGQFSASVSLGIFIGFVILCILAGKIWQKIDYRYSLEWCLKQLNKKNDK